MKEYSREAEDDEPIPLRPHHLLCTQGFGGKGYSEQFVERMTAVVRRLRGDPAARVRICQAADAICAACPSKLDEAHCRDDAKVLRYDKAVRELLDLREGVYSYRALIRRLDALLAEGDGDERLRAICGDCAWYPISACRKNILDQS